MGGIFGVVSKDDCINELFYGTDYHSHLGTMRGGLAARNSSEITRFIHDISNAQFRSKFEDDVAKLHGTSGIGVISDNEDQPLIISSRLGTYAIVTVAKINNIDELRHKVIDSGFSHFAEMGGGNINPTELTAALINSKTTFEDGIRYAQEQIDGSCSMLLLTDDGIYAARDRLGRTPIILGAKDGANAATMETCAFPNIGFEITRYLGPGEVVLLTPEGVEKKVAPGDEMQICAFLWVYYGYPASHYEGINVEAVRYRCGEMLADNDNKDLEIDYVAGIPDSGIGHAIGYAMRSGVPYVRPYTKYTPTWPRSFMPQDQSHRNLVARMKLIPIRELIEGKRILFCEDSIVRGTQLRETVKNLFSYDAKELHMRPACPPLIWSCKYLNFSQSRSEMDLAGRWAIEELVGGGPVDLSEYADASSGKHAAMVEVIGKRLGLTTLKYQKLEDLVEAIGLPKEKLCTYCWDGCEGPCSK